MEKKIRRRFYIIPALYILMTGFFFFMHYTQQLSFSRAIGNIELTGKATKGTPVRPSEIKKLNMFVNGMSFLFNSRKVLTIETADGITHKSILTNYEEGENSFTLFFDNEIRLEFSTDFADNKISVRADLPETVPPITSLSLPFKEDRGFALGYTEEDNTPVISNGETNFFLAMTNEYVVDSQNDFIKIAVPDNNPVTLVIQETLVSKGRTAEKWYEQNSEDLSSEYSEAVSTFVNNAFFGWNSRFNSKTGMWTDAEGEQQFNETTARSYLSESLTRGSYRTSASLIRTASVALENELTAWSAPYIGNIVVETRDLISDQNLERREIIAQLDAENQAILSRENLLDFMRSNRLENQIDKVLTMSSSILDSDSLGRTITKLQIINSVYNDYPDRDYDAFIIDTVEQHILPSVNWLDEGLFLDEEGQVNVESSFRAGRELLRSGNLLDNDFYRTVGMKMIISILSRAGESAFIPAFLITEDNRISSESGTILPEDFYYDLTENPYYVRQEPLDEILGAGSWILTSASSQTIQKSTRETIVTINFPKGSIHHFAIKGVKPFVRIYMHGMKWNSDPNFQRYSDGWVYDKATETLYVKLKHRVDNERLSILYYNPDLETTPATNGEMVETSPAASEESSQ
ncbi:hypothetical protein [Spirochaeta isovalerica]|uniref:Uncharacterized protein n=1 Tax=Spirochaeta isovalerica TaxID=150 RepID=A0A841RG63_9SPIO|nr:hypothetical protein [Spirochaeta isovalerica]MBB6482381.1 hypothetical protein [Spirochaeta isovalerica]